MVKDKKDLNPVQSQREIPDNGRTLERKQARDARNSRPVVSKFQQQISDLKDLEAKGRISAGDRAILAQLEDDLRNNRRNHVPEIISEKTKAAEKEGLVIEIPKNPKKSIYYDPVYNPYGVPPPGMAYREVRSDGESEEISDNDSTTSSTRAIPMPQGTPPSLSGSEYYESNDDEYTDVPVQQSPQVQDRPAPYRPHIPPPNRQQDPLARFTPDSPDAKLADPAQDTLTAQKPAPLVISAAPQMKDLRKEAAKLVPQVVRRRGEKRKAVIPEDREADQSRKRQEQDLLSTLPKRINAAPDID
ncbi:Protein saf1 [Neolecta irregularis DAH-3]|uniref:Protein saf1 n=1 Tax=Neolecta irregularis (strain DAH-3) TaxID=1198029 RepID=A0A1U7LL33_NEOID|nr:Protein saf1 [Neolecta irregularis DAH-3]|eukprot:OLL23231.1 Protein saf1 [Neolecta irregularis DAH-3]